MILTSPPSRPTTRWCGYTASVCGPRHQRLGEPNQDAVLRRLWRDRWLLVVSDGLGSRRYARRGAQLACQSVCSTLARATFDIRDRDLIQALYQEWLMRLGAIQPGDAAATCLIAWGTRSGEVRLFQLGDGVILYQSEEFGCLSPRSEYQFVNETTGLGISRRLSDWQTARINLAAPGQGVALMTDGLSDDLINEHLLLQELQPVLTRKSPRLVKRWLERQLIDWDTPNHSDDKSIALIYRT